MFERIKKTLSELIQTIRDPDRTDKLEHQADRLRGEVRAVTEELNEARSELDARHATEDAHIEIGQKFFDCSLYSELMRDFDAAFDRDYSSEADIDDIEELSEATPPTRENATVTIKAFIMDPGYGPCLEVNAELVPVKAFLQRVADGGLVPDDTTTGPASLEHDGRTHDLTERMEARGFMPLRINQDVSTWVNIRDETDRFSFDIYGLDQLQDFVEGLETEKMCGMLLYPSGEFLTFSSPDNLSRTTTTILIREAHTGSELSSSDVIQS